MNINVFLSVLSVLDEFAIVICFCIFRTQSAARLQRRLCWRKRIMTNSLSWSLSSYLQCNTLWFLGVWQIDMKIVKVGKTPEEKIEPDKLDGDVDTTEAI